MHYMQYYIYICSHKFITNMRANKLFKEWYDSLPRDTYKSVRDEIIRKCYISKAVFYNWYGNITPIPRLAQITIEVIAKKDIFND